MLHPLRAYRDRNKLSQKKLAERLNVSRSMVCLVETGARAITAKKATEWAALTGIPKSQLCPDIFGS